MALFTLTTYTEELDYAAADAVLIDEDTREAGLREALDALDSQHWDSIDERGDGTAILYPADCDTDYRTGAVTRTQLVVKGRASCVDRLLEVWRNQ